MMYSKAHYYNCICIAVATALLLAAAVASAWAEPLPSKVSEIKGMAVYRRGGDGWRPVEVGVELSPGAEVRLQDNARLEAAWGGRGSWVADGSCRLSILDAAGDPPEKFRPGIKLEHGRLALLYQPEVDGEIMLVETPITTVTAGPGVYSVVTDGDEFLTIASGDGEICLSLAGKRTCVENGRMLEVSLIEGELDGHVYDVDHASSKLWKKLNWPVAPKKPNLKIVRPQDGAFFSDPNIYIVGSTTPGASVTVNKTELPTRDNGSFSGMISLYEGENTLSFRAVSLSGGTESVTHVVYLDNTPPLLTISQPIDGFDPTMSGTCDASNCYIQIFGLTEPGVSLLINGVNASRYIEDDGSFLIQDYPIRSNDRSLTIEVEDMLRQRTVEIIHVSPPEDSDGDGTPDMLDACPLDPSC